MKILSWNIVSLRAILRKKRLIGLIEKEDPDIIILQEIKINHRDLVSSFVNLMKNKGYSCNFNYGPFGTAFISRIRPLSIENKEDGRLQLIVFPRFYLLNIYVPNAGDKLKYLERRISWDQRFDELIDTLNDRNLLIMGDFNVVHEEKDIWIPSNMRAQYKSIAGYSPQERENFDYIFDKYHLIDLYNGPRAYSFYAYRSNANKQFFEGVSNRGWRIDYSLLKNHFEPDMPYISPFDPADFNVKYLKWEGSDHLPMILDYRGTVTSTPMTTVKFSKGYFRQTRFDKDHPDRPMYRMFEYADNHNLHFYVAKQNSEKNYVFGAFHKKNFLENYKGGCFYEIIRKNTRCKAFMDLDKCSEEDFQRMYQVLSRKFKIYALKSNNGYHIIFKKKFPNVEDVKIFILGLIDTYNLVNVDTSVYTKNRFMRMPFSSKFGKNDPLIPVKKNYDINYYLIT